MEIDYIIWNIVGITIVFFVFIIFFIRFSTIKIIKYINTNLTSQIELSNKFFEKNNLMLYKKIEARSNVIEQIDIVLRKINLTLNDNEKKIEELNFLCSNRKFLENEVTKLKKIIKRLEKKNEI